MPDHPIFSIVTVVYKKEEQLPYFFESILRQTFKGKIEIVVVIDCSPDNSLQVTQQFGQLIAKVHPNINVVILNTETNVGNCVARNKGLMTARGDFLVITDPDCLLSQNFLDEYFVAFQDAEVVVSHFGVELGIRPPIETLMMYERDLPKVALHQKVQDPQQPNSFLNCVTRGVAIKKSLVRQNLYDPQFSYVVTNKETGFGWEDVDAGYTLWSQGARFAFAEKAFTVHISHTYTANRNQKPVQSLKNYRRLHQKNTEIYQLKKDWSLKTYRVLCVWHLRNRYFQITEDMRFLDRHFGLGKLFRFSLYGDYLKWLFFRC